MPCHPETRQEGNGKLEDKGCNMRSKSYETEVKDLALEDEMIENIIQHPLQNQVQAAASRVTEQLKAHEFSEWRIEKVYDRSQCAFYPGFYVFQG